MYVVAHHGLYHLQSKLGATEIDDPGDTDLAERVSNRDASAPVGGWDPKRLQLRMAPVARSNE